ncbi:hypothetical protein [Streptosporangium sp. V21-05]|uniref:hypothetical protein n=1 Tax=Streptosporangium sp. V21-05 TaxID=3446115 RepID=UPI003F535600
MGGWWPGAHPAAADRAQQRRATQSTGSSSLTRSPSWSPYANAATGHPVRRASATSSARTRANGTAGSATEHGHVPAAVTST